MSNQPQLSQAQANLQITLWNKQAEATSDDDLYIRIQQLGFSEEIVSRLHDLITKVQDIAGKVIRIGKMVLIKILDFVEEHFFLVAGIGIGAILGAAIFGLMTSIPFIGPMLVPIAKIIGISFNVAGAVTGHQLDQVIPDVGKSLREIVEAFFSFFAQILKAVFGTDSQPYAATAI